MEVQKYRLRTGPDDAPSTCSRAPLGKKTADRGSEQPPIRRGRGSFSPVDSLLEYRSTAGRSRGRETRRARRRTLRRRRDRRSLGLGAWGYALAAVDNVTLHKTHARARAPQSLHRARHARTHTRTRTHPTYRIRTYIGSRRVARTTTTRIYLCVYVHKCAYVTRVRAHARRTHRKSRGAAVRRLCARLTIRVHDCESHKHYKRAPDEASVFFFFFSFDIRRVTFLLTQDEPDG